MLIRPAGRDDPLPPPAVGTVEPGTVEKPGDDVPQRTPQVVASDSPASVVSAQQAISNPDCRMVVGQQSASDTALVVVPLADGAAWFGVVDDLGVVFDGTMPFLPARHVLGKRADGTVLVGLELEGELRIVHDGHSIYELDEVADFDIAVDGSSFFVVEPMAGNSSRLVVRNLDLREEHHVDLGAALPSNNALVNAAMSYSTDFGEVRMAFRDWEATTNRFYPVSGGNHREVVVKHRRRGFPKDISVFSTSEVSYHAHNLGHAERNQLNQHWKIVKVRREFGTDEHRETEVWTREAGFFGPVSMRLSEDGAWLLLSDLFSGVGVLDTTTGERVFSYPRDRDLRLAMLMSGRSSRYYPKESLLARFGARFVDGRLFVFRYSEDKPDEGRFEVFQLNRASKTVRRVDGFEVKRAVDESEQSFASRTELDLDNPVSCKEYALLDRILVIRDGQLTYRPSGAAHSP